MMRRQATLLALGLLLLSVPAWAQVVVDNGGKAGTGTTPALTCLITNFAVGAGSNRALFVGSSTNSANVVSAVTFGATSFPGPAAVVQTKGTTNTAEIWVLTNPANATSTITVTYLAAVNTTCGAMSFTGVHQTTPFINTNTNTGSSTAPSVAITNPANNISMDDVAPQGSVPGSPTQTQAWATGANNTGGGSYGTGSGTNTHTWTLGASNNWASVGLSVNAASGAAKPGMLPEAWFPAPLQPLTGL